MSLKGREGGEREGGRERGRESEREREGEGEGERDSEIVRRIEKMNTPLGDITPEWLLGDPIDSNPS